MASPPFESSSSVVQPVGPRALPGTPAGKAAGLAVQALSKAARSFVLYDAQNALVRQLIEQFRDHTKQALSLCGDLPLDFAPFEVSLRGEVVYQDVDREKSLPFKLFRDGVRRLTFLPGVTTDELVRLLEIVALRYTAMRQQEDDSVTLLRRAGLMGIELIAVVGFAPAEERPEADAPQTFGGPVIEPPADYDTPLPILQAPSRVVWHEVPAAELAALQALEAEDGWAVSAVALGGALLREANQAGWPTPRTDLVNFFVELRDAMVADGAFGPLCDLLAMLEQDAGVRAEVLRGLAKPEALDAVLDAIPGENPMMPPELFELLPFVGGGAPLVDRLLAEKDARRSGLLLELVLADAPASADTLVSRLPQLAPPLLVTLARSLAAKSPRLALEVSRLLLARPDVPTKLSGLEALAVAHGEGVMTVLLMQLDAPAPEVRQRALEVVLRKADPVATTRLVQVLENRDRPLPEVEAVGRALALLAPVVAAKHFLAWAHPATGQLTPQQKRLQWAAVSGMAVLKGAGAEKLLLAVLEHATEPLKRHCQAALDEHRKAPHG